LTTDQWADYLIFSFYPRQRVFIDGRSDFYGESLGREYLQLMQGTRGFELVLNRYGFEVALVPPDWPICAYLRRAQQWRVIEENAQAALFVRSPKETRLQSNVTDSHSRT
jgi:hypothetical protein